MSSQLDRIIGGQPGEASILSDVVALLSQKNKDYGDNAQALGVKGQFSDIWRKIGKLRTALWDGKELQGEQPEEILMDLIGHCLLTIDILREDGKVPKVVGHLDMEDEEVWELEKIDRDYAMTPSQRAVLRKIIRAVDGQ